MNEIVSQVLSTGKKKKSVLRTAWDFTVEMETGTGKTYVYLRTVYELHKRYGFSKFIIVVPSIAIKEGVFKSIELMREHFRTLYDGVANGVGFTAITVAWLSQLNAFAMVVISAMLAVLTKGAETLQPRLAVPTSISEIITGILLFSMLGCEFFINFRLILRAKKQRKQEEKAEKEAVK